MMVFSNFITDVTSYIIVFTLGYVCNYVTVKQIKHTMASNIKEIGSTEPVTLREVSPVRSRVFKPFSLGMLNKEYKDEKAFVPDEPDDTIEKRVERMNYNVRD